jgi:hypothetical protein
MDRSIYLYTYKLNISQGRPSMKWLWRCKWLYVAYEDREKERFMHIVSELERKEYPFVKLMIKTRIKGLLVVKVLKIRDLLSFWLPNHLYDAIISLSRLDSLEAVGMWNVEELEPNRELLALYSVGKHSTIKTGLLGLKSKYEALIKEL